MKTKDPLIQLLIQHFPQHWRQIRWLLQENEDFRELCDDYSACIEMQRQWRPMKTPSTQKWLEEYEVLQSELETEISDFLKKADLHE